uniref:Uncharacterized protein n=1 Tax=Cannabis sativa TaxID=3483 RepID=A0A803R939_CANSA
MSVAPSSKVLTTLNTVTFSGTETNLIFHETITPKLAPPPPLIAQKRSSPMSALFKILPLTSTITASIILSTVNPCFLIKLP